MPSGGAILIAAASGRALAASARRGGTLPLVADFFADEDTVGLASACVRLPDGLARGMREQALVAALDRLAAGRRPAGVICGTGFEDRPDLLARIAERWTLYGNGAEVVARVKDPVRFARLCAQCDIPHPEVSLQAPPAPAGWLAKRRGGAGGGHIRDAAGAASREGTYFQRRVAGTPVSALFLADGRRAVVLGFSAQWPAPAPGQPFRYGGAVRPADIPPTTGALLEDTVARLVQAAGLVGLNSADFLLDGEHPWLLEVNPRPGATMELFETPDTPLVALHVAACGGALRRPPPLPGAAAAAIVYAERDIPAFPPLAWPDWAADRPHRGSTISAGEPLCSVWASAPGAQEARRLVERRAIDIRAATRARAA